LINAIIPPKEGDSLTYLITERIILSTLVIYAVFAPHSIAITQGAYLLGFLAWGVQLAASRNFRQPRTPVDLALFGFFACCVVSSFLSYDPMVSIKGLKSPAFFFAFYFVCNKTRSARFARFLCLMLVLSCLVNVAYSAAQVAKGRGVRIDSITPSSPFAKEGIRAGDVILEVDGQKIKTEHDISRIVGERRGRLKVKYLRSELLKEASVSRRDAKKALEAEGMGIATSPGRSFRVSGFYSHYETYAEVLQLIAALALGMLISLPDKKRREGIFLAVAAALISATLMMTATRAAMLGLALAVICMAMVRASRRAVLITLMAVLLLLPAAFFALERARGSSIFDPHEGSASYRLTVWGEALRLIKSHPVFGIGKGSEGKLKEALGLYDKGRLPPGHFHSTPIQIAAWWGLPALAFYFSFMTIFFVELRRLFKEARARGESDIAGVVLGVIGALVAFNVSSVVHFNFGDGEVVMHLWLLTGLAFAVRRQALLRVSVSSKAQPSAEDSQRNPLQEQEAVSESGVRAAGAGSNSMPQ
jgi:hypothetical protein